MLIVQLFESHKIVCGWYDSHHSCQGLGQNLNLRFDNFPVIYYPWECIHIH